MLLLQAGGGAGPSLLRVYKQHKSRKVSQTSGPGQDSDKGTAYRKKVVYRIATADDKKTSEFSKIKNWLWKIQLGTEEINIIKDCGTVTHFNYPKVQASLSTNTFVITSHPEAKPIPETLPGAVSQLGADSLARLGKLTEHSSQQVLDSEPPKPGDIEDEEGMF